MWEVGRNVACITERTHVILVYGLCDGARFAIQHNFALINHEPKHWTCTSSIYSLHPVSCSYPEVLIFHTIFKPCF